MWAVLSASITYKKEEVRIMKRIERKIIASILCVSASSAVSADVLVSNLNQSSNFTPSSTGLHTNSIIYSSQFVTGTDLSEVFSATARLRNASGFGDATYEAYIYTDSGMGPDSLVASFDSTPTIVDGGGTQTVSFASVAGIELDSNTAYWLGVRNTTGTYMGWEATGSDAESSTVGWTIDDEATYRSSNNGASWQDYTATYGGKVFKFAIEGNTVPAPGALMLLSAGGAIASRRRR